MRILHTSDWHVGRTIRGRSRHEEHLAVLRGMIRLVDREGIDLVVVAGDQFDTATPSAQSERIVWLTLLEFARRGAAVVVVAGNHDNAARLRAVAPLLTRHGDIHVGAQVAAPDAGGTVRVRTSAGDARVALVPFLSQRGIVRSVDLLAEGRDDGHHAQAYAERVAWIVEGLTRDFGDGTAVDLVLAHLTVLGGGTIGDRLGGGERLSQIFDYVVPAQAFPTTAHYVALGHLHQPHTIPGPCPVRYSGSPLHLDFGEVASARGVTIIDVEPDRPATVRHVPLDGGWPLVTLTGDLAGLTAQAEELGPQAYVRAVVEEAPRAGLAADVRAAVPQAVDVRIAAPEHDVAEEPDAAGLDVAAPRDLLAAYLDERGIVDERVLALFDELLGDVDTAGADAP